MVDLSTWAASCFASARTFMIMSVVIPRARSVASCASFSRHSTAVTLMQMTLLALQSVHPGSPVGLPGSLHHIRVLYYPLLSIKGRGHHTVKLGEVTHRLNSSAG